MPIFYQADAQTSSKKEEKLRASQGNCRVKAMKDRPTDKLIKSLSNRATSNHLNAIGSL